MLTILAIIFIISLIVTLVIDHDEYMGIGGASFMLSVLSGIALLIVTIIYIHAGKKAEYLKRNYDIEYSRDDIFWNESLIDNELRTKGIIVDTNQKLNIDLNHE